MRLIGLLLSLAVIAYAISVYIDSSTRNISTDEVSSRPKELLEQADQTAAQMNKILEQRQQQLDNAGN